MDSTYSVSSFSGIGVVEAEIGLAFELVGQAEVQTDCLGVSNVQVAVRFRRKARLHLAGKLIGLQILADDVADEV